MHRPRQGDGQPMVREQARWSVHTTPDDGETEQKHETPRRSSTGQPQRTTRRSRASGTCARGARRGCCRARTAPAAWCPSPAAQGAAGPSRCRCPGTAARTAKHAAGGDQSGTHGWVEPATPAAAHLAAAAAQGLLRVQQRACVMVCAPAHRSRVRLHQLSHPSEHLKRAVDIQIEPQIEPLMCYSNRRVGQQQSLTILPK